MSKLPKGWIQTKVSDLADIGSSKRIMQDEYQDTGVPFYRSTEVILRSKKLAIGKSLHIPRERFEDLKLRFGAPKENDILVTAVGTIGVVYLVEDREFYFKDGNLLWLRNISEQIMPSYLAKYLSSNIFQNDLWRIIGGSSQSALTIEKMEELFVNVPSKKEQNKLVEILTSIDKVIELTEIEIEKLKNLKKGMMQDLLTKGIGHTKFKNSPIGKIPENWEVEKLRKITSKVGSGKTPSGGSAVYQETGILFIRSQNIYFDGLRTKGLSYITNEVHSTMKNSSLEKYDLLLNISGASIGRACVLPAYLVPANINQHVCIIRFKEKREINCRYYKYCLESELGQNQVRTTNSAGNREGLNFEQVRDFKFACPPDEEKERIVASLDSVERATTSRQKKLIKLKDMKKGLMQDLLTGKIRVKI